VFVKTSSRSAKDAPVFNSRIRTLMAKFMDGLEDTTNNRLFALLQAATDMLRMTTAQEVLDAFMRSSRISDDMRLALDRKDRFRENFVVRKWHNIAIDMEYRAFVYKGKMTAMSQYNHVLYSPRVVSKGHQIMRDCFQFWEANLRDSLAANEKLESYVVDFAVCGEEFGDRQAPQEGPMKIWVIELNPFWSTTDGALFSWTTEREILENGSPEDGAMVTRVQEDSRLSGIKAVVAVDWRELLDCPLEEITKNA
jgi:D123